MAIYFGRNKQRITINDSYLAGSVSKPLKPEEVTYNDNGTYYVYPESGTLLSKVTVNVDVDDRFSEGYTEGEKSGKAEGFSEGYNKGCADAKPDLRPLTVTENSKLYSPNGEFDGYTEVLVNIENLGVNTDIVESGICGKNGDNIYYDLYKNGVLYIKGNGETKNYNSNMFDSPFANLKSQIKNVVIDNDVNSNDHNITSIGDALFIKCSELESIIIPNTVTYIGKHAFFKSGINTINIPYSVKTISESAFNFCYKLTNITIDNGVKSIGNSAFYNCNKLTTAVIPDSVTSIGTSVFMGCSNLTDISLPKTITKLPNSMFKDCVSLKNIFIPKSVTSINENAFDGVDLENIIYEGTQDEWDLIIIGDGNETLHDATIIFGHTVLDCDIDENGQYKYEAKNGQSYSLVNIDVKVPDRFEEGASAGREEGYTIGKIDGIAEGIASIKIQPEKTTVENGIIEPDEGFDAIKSVNVNVTNVDTINGWHIEVLTNDSEPEAKPYPTITFVCKEG